MRIVGSRFWVNTSVHVGFEVAALLTQFSTAVKGKEGGEGAGACETEASQWSQAQSPFLFGLPLKKFAVCFHIRRLRNEGAAGKCGAETGQWWEGKRNAVRQANVNQRIESVWF